MYCSFRVLILALFYIDIAIAHPEFSDFGSSRQLCKYVFIEQMLANSSPNAKPVAGVPNIRGSKIESTYTYFEYTGPKKASIPMIITLPPGPGLNSEVFVPALKILKEYADIVFVHPPGTKHEADSPFADNPGSAYSQTLEGFEDVVRELRRSKDQPVIGIGASFGGIQLGDLLLRRETSGINFEGAVWISSPLRKQTYDDLRMSQLNKYPYLYRKWRSAADNYSNNPSLDNFKAILLAYDGMIFSRHHPETKDYITEFMDRGEVSPTSLAFVHKRWGKHDDFAKKIGQISGIKKLAIMGSEDGLFPSMILERDYLDAGIDVKNIFIISETSHFSFLDRPTVVREAIINAFELSLNR